MPHGCSNIDCTSCHSCYEYTTDEWVGAMFFLFIWTLLVAWCICIGTDSYACMGTRRVHYVDRDRF